MIIIDGLFAIDWWLMIYRFLEFGIFKKKREKNIYVMGW